MKKQKKKTNPPTSEKEGKWALETEKILLGIETRMIIINEFGTYK
jgi:hypothetical protein